MINLAGDKNANIIIVDELNQANVPIIPLNHWVKNSEVPTNLIGQSNGFIFERAWYYWIVRGLVPLKTAQELYYDPIGKKDVRVSGHCGCPPPEEWSSPSEEIQEQIKKSLGYKNNMMDIHEIMDFWKINENKYKEELKKYPQFIHHYHIDSQEGLNLFAKTIYKLKY